MIGLEYILNLYNIQHNDLAEKLDIKRQNINLWIKKKQNISKKYLPILSNMFDIPEVYFQKEINEFDKLEIQKIKIKQEIKKSEFIYDEAIYNSETGESIATIKQKGYNDVLEYEYEYKELEIRQLQLLSKIERIISVDNEYACIGEEKYTKIFDRFADIVEAQESGENEDQDLTVLYYVIRALELTSSLDNNHRYIGKEHPKSGSLNDNNKYVQQIVSIIKDLKPK